MYLLLLMFGGLLAAAGVILTGSGMSLRDGTFDAAILTPGIVAAAGGLLLIGLGAGLRTLQRIERTLASRPMPRALPITESAKTAETVETPREPVRIPFVPKVSDELNRASRHARVWSPSRWRLRSPPAKTRHQLPQFRWLFPRRLLTPQRSIRAKTAMERREFGPGSATRRAVAERSKPITRCGSVSRSDRPRSPT